MYGSTSNTNLGKVDEVAKDQTSNKPTPTLPTAAAATTAA
jgi:hypothetical protein